MKPSKKTESVSRRLPDGGRRKGRSSDFDTYMDFYQGVYMPYYQNYHHNYLSYPYPQHHPAAAQLPSVRYPYPYPYPNPWMLQYHPSQPVVEMGSMSGGTSATMENKKCNDKKVPASQDDVNSDEVEDVEVRNVGSLDTPFPLPQSPYHPVILPPPMIMRKATIAPIMKINSQKKSAPAPVSPFSSPSSSNDELKD